MGVLQRTYGRVSNVAMQCTVLEMELMVYFRHGEK